VASEAIYDSYSARDAKGATTGLRAQPREGLASRGALVAGSKPLRQCAVRLEPENRHANWIMARFEPSVAGRGQRPFSRRLLPLSSDEPVGRITRYSPSGGVSRLRDSTSCNQQVAVSPSNPDHPLPTLQPCLWSALALCVRPPTGPRSPVLITAEAAGAPCRSTQLSQGCVGGLGSPRGCASPQAFVRRAFFSLD